MSLLFISDPEFLLNYGGMLIIALIVYGTTGLFFCFFIPSSAVLFAAGILTASGKLDYNIAIVCIILVITSFAGCITGYWFGRKVGPLLYKRDDSRFFRKQHLKTAESFYKKYGGLALTMGLYLPIIRTFVSIVAGVIRLNSRSFLLLSFAGSCVWVVSFVLAGYFIGSISFLKEWSNYIILGFLLFVTIPLIFKVLKELKALKKENSEN